LSNKASVPDSGPITNSKGQIYIPKLNMRAIPSPILGQQQPNTERQGQTQANAIQSSIITSQTARPKTSSSRDSKVESSSNFTQKKLQILQKPSNDHQNAPSNLITIGALSINDDTNLTVAPIPAALGIVPEDLERPNTRRSKLRSRGTDVSDPRPSSVGAGFDFAESDAAALNPITLVTTDASNNINIITVKNSDHHQTSSAVNPSAVVVPKAPQPSASFSAGGRRGKHIAPASNTIGRDAEDDKGVAVTDSSGWPLNATGAGAGAGANTPTITTAQQSQAQPLSAREMAAKYRSAAQGSLNFMQ
jgi:hypothetical protein